LFHFGSLQSLFALHLKFNWLRSVLEPLLVFLGQFILQLAPLHNAAIWCILMPEPNLLKEAFS
ncbi:MAG: hypothetical protein LBS96_09220, partial [Oscillospiraceae bacterium]|nr:hypothetical protein [Oscillospiraceae bacterium]